MSNNTIRRAVRCALVTSAAAATAGPTFAADQTIQEVVVTGSRIAQPNLETPAQSPRSPQKTSPCRA